jgi:DNA-binding MarR family transcriptional regulator/N-acetylglutamate synthase-like GNAT family acetyltransferase
MKEHIDALRAFNRFYTRRIGVLREEPYGSGFSLPQTRVLWELAHHPQTGAAELARALEIDPGYLSRLLAGLKARGLLQSTPVPGDARRSLLSLSAAGRRAFAPVNRRSQERTAALLSNLREAEQTRLLEATATIEALLGERAASTRAPPYLLRTHRPGDIGWIVSRHGALYAQEFGYDSSFEAFVAKIGGMFLERFDPRVEACWIAEQLDASGMNRNVGSVCVVRARHERSHKAIAGVAQLRLLLVEPSARGLGIGERLVAECERFARFAGYKRLRLWTASHLAGARAIYRRAGYRRISTQAHHSFGLDLVAEVWELDLG